MHERNCMVTLTFDDLHLPLSLDYSLFQDFMKRLRKHCGPKRVRFFMSGEYGERFARPHFHALLFGYDFPDRIYFSKSPSGASVFTSVLLSRLWRLGFSSVGDVTFESAAYVARYVMKKVTGDPAVEHYSVVDQDTGELVQRVPEFCHMSLKPGIGARWLLKYQSDVYPDGYVVVNGRRVKPPRYYDKRFKRVDEGEFSELVARREFDAQGRRADNTDARLVVKEQVTAARLRNLKRSF